MRAEIIATGSELLSGGVLETNSLFLSEGLLLLGVETAFKTVVGDNEKDMEEAVKLGLQRADVVLITGGLGPTEDDITRKVVAKIAKKRLILNDDALAAIKAVLSSKGKEYLVANDRQALIPAGARILRNPVGIAPGFYLKEEGKFLAVIPGVPQEARAMFNEGLRQALEEHVSGKLFIRRRVLRTCGMSEAAVNQAIQDVLKQGRPAVGLTAKETGVDVRILVKDSNSERSQAILERTEAAIRNKLGDAVYAVDDQEMEEVVGALLKQRRLRLSTAESCTGGLISGRITNIPGSSEYFERGVVVYSNLSKTELLGVPKELIERHGAVSREVAVAMAKGIRQASHADLGLAVTGIAGPGGGAKDKPVGLIFTALASAHDVKVKEHVFLGTRDQIRLKSSQMALDMVRRYLIG